MKSTIYTIRDVKTTSYTRILQFSHEAQAIRGFTTAANDPENEIGRYPEDFELYALGEFESESGKLTPFDAPHWVACAASLIKKPLIQENNKDVNPKN